MKPELSIIIPCYNCVDTLEESVASVYAQELSIPFEIVMVNDASTDATLSLIEQLAEQHPEISYSSHNKNKGGGAARNTGIRNSQGTLLYCLDSDNIFDHTSLERMVAFLHEHGLDGVVFSDRRFFRGKTQNFTTQYNTVLGRDIQLTDLFNDTHTLLDNFLYTRTAYERTSGYPEHHGFDTQAFEVRFLSAGNKVQVCPETYFYHRHGLGGKSYFERVYASGMFSLNYSLICEDMFHLLASECVDEIVSFPLFTDNKLGRNNILKMLQDRVASGAPFLSTEHHDYQNAAGKDRWLKDHVTLSAPHSIMSAVLHLEQGNYIESQKCFDSYISETQKMSPYLILLSLRISHAIAGVPYGKLIPTSLEAARELVPKKYTHTSPAVKMIAEQFPALYSVLIRFKKLISS